MTSDLTQSVKNSLKPLVSDNMSDEMLDAWLTDLAIAAIRVIAPAVERALRERDQAVEALKTTNAWLDRWARHIGDCPGIDDCACGLTRVRYEAITALAGDSHDNTIKCGTECPYSHDGFHHVDTSMESGPNNCFYCKRSMP